MTAIAKTIFVKKYEFMRRMRCMFECLTYENSSVFQSLSCDPDYNIFVCGPEFGEANGCEPETEAQMCGPDYGEDCMPDCGPSDGSDDRW